MADANENQETIHVKMSREGEVPLRFKIKKHMPLRKLFNSYAERLNIQIHMLRFYFDNQRLHETDTPAGVDLEEDDQIDVHGYVDGGGKETNFC